MTAPDEPLATAAHRCMGSFGNWDGSSILVQVRDSPVTDGDVTVDAQKKVNWSNRPETGLTLEVVNPVPSAPPDARTDDVIGIAG